MAKTILKRLLQTIPVLFVVVTLTFILTRMIPGNPAMQMLGPQASPDAIATLEEEMGLNRPMLEQYVGVPSWVFSRAISAIPIPIAVLCCR